jgi:salicylate hydroxylase
MSPLKIAIIGGGIGGPAAAIGLARNGHKVTLYERATSIGGVGFAFRITPNSDRCLKFLGIDTQAGGAVTANTSRMMNANGEVLREVKENKNQDSGNGAFVFAYRV